MTGEGWKGWVLAGVLACSQGMAGQSAGTASTAAPVATSTAPAAAGTAFEVVSIRLSPPDSGFTSISPVGGTTFLGKRVSMQLLLGLAFGTPAKYMVNAPPWLDSQAYDVEAKIAGDKGMSAKERQVLLQQMLKDRFKLAVHRDTKEISGYALVTGKNGPRLEASKGEGAAYILADRFVFPSGSMSDLAALLASVTGRPVVDRTGIAGTYALHLEYAPVNDPESTLPSLFTALEDTMGLKLTPAKVAVEELVIDHVERVPTEN